MESEISKRRTQATVPNVNVPFSSLLFNVEDSVLVENQQQIIAECGGFRALLSAALSDEALQFGDIDTNVLSKYASKWDPNISPLINNVSNSLCDLVSSHGWMCRVDTKYASNFEGSMAQMIYDFAAKTELIIELPPSQTRETVFSIGARCKGKMTISGFANREMENVNGITDGMKVWSDREYVFQNTEDVPQLKGINKYFLSNHKSNGIGTAPKIKLVNPSIDDAVYLFLETTHTHHQRHGGWASKLPSEGWKQIGSIIWTGSCTNSNDVWEYALKSLAD